MKAAGLVRSAVRGLLDLVFPPGCAVCGVSPVGGGVCEACFRAIPLAGDDRCLGCGRILEPYAGARPRCNECRSARYPFRRAFAAGKYDGPVKTLIHRLKYSGDFSVLPALRRMVEHAVVRLNVPGDYGRIVPVPLFIWDEVDRGFNQSSLIAEFVAGMLGGSVSRVLKKRRRTPRQVRLAGTDRRKNLRGVFACRRGACRGEKVLLVDDVFTTGATLAECAATLLRQGEAARVDVFALAR